MGQTEDAQALGRRRLALDPLSPAAHAEMGWIYYDSRRYDEAIVAFEKALGLDPNFSSAVEGLGHTYLEKKMFPEAIRAYGKVKTLVNLVWLGNAYARAGARDKALKILKELNAISKQQYVPPGAFAWIYVGLGDKDQAFRCLEKALEEHDASGFPMAKVFPAWDPLRSDPRYQDLLRRMNFPK
jgi:tetratricopeptide (TPR) repeat protein